MASLGFSWLAWLQLIFLVWGRVGLGCKSSFVVVPGCLHLLRLGIIGAKAYKKVLRAKLVMCAVPYYTTHSHLPMGPIGDLIIENVRRLSSFTGLGSLKDIGRTFNIKDASVTSFQGLDHLTRVSGQSEGFAHTA